MNGQIVSYASTTGTGIIKVDEESYTFAKAEWQESLDPTVGDEVNFELQDGNVTQITLVNILQNQMRPVKYRTIAGLLGIVFGAVGAHRFYLGFWGLGLAQIAVTFITGGFGVLWGFIEGILIISAQIDKDAKGRSLK